MSVELKESQNRLKDFGNTICIIDNVNIKNQEEIKFLHDKNINLERNIVNNKQIYDKEIDN